MQFSFSVNSFSILIILQNMWPIIRVSRYRPSIFNDYSVGPRRCTQHYFMYLLLTLLSHQPRLDVLWLPDDRWSGSTPDSSPRPWPLNYVTTRVVPWPKCTPISKQVSLVKCTPISKQLSLVNNRIAGIDILYLSPLRFILKTLSKAEIMLFCLYKIHLNTFPTPNRKKHTDITPLFRNWHL